MAEAPNPDCVDAEVLNVPSGGADANAFENGLDEVVAGVMRLKREDAIALALQFNQQG